MKKLKKIIVCFLLAIVMIPSFMVVATKANAAGETAPIFTKPTFSAEINSILTDYVQFDSRAPGSQGEKQASVYIQDYLNLLTYLKPKNDTHTKNGVQTFQFESKFTGKYETSQNIVYTTDTLGFDKKVVIGCHYDAVAFKMNEETGIMEEVASESVNGSAASVALLLTLAKNIQQFTLNYNVEFVFFGAGESNNAGSKVYTQGVSKQEAENVLCMINLDEIAYGNNLYFYSDEVNTSAQDFVVDVIKEKGTDIDKVDVVNLNKVTYVYDELGLGYTHVALQSDNVNFMKLGITTFSFFAGDYSKGLVAGKSEYLEAADNITWTANDNLTYIANTQTADYVLNNLYEVFKTIEYTLTDFDFVNVMKQSAGDSAWVYTLFGNQTLVTYLTVFAFIALVIVAMFVYYKLSIKAYNANVEVEFLSSVVKICEQIDETGQDPNVAKAVSQVIARDIKKDKKIKSKKKKDSE